MKKYRVVAASLAVVMLSLSVYVFAFDPTYSGHTWGEIDCQGCITSTHIAEDAVHSQHIDAQGLYNIIDANDGPGSGIDVDTVGGLSTGNLCNKNGGNCPSSMEYTLQCTTGEWRSTSCNDLDSRHKVSFKSGPMINYCPSGYWVFGITNYEIKGCRNGKITTEAQAVCCRIV